MGIIYCYINKINGKRYVGQTINPEQRYKQHRSSAFNVNDESYNTPLHRAFRKYGYENFEYVVLASDLSIEKMNELEIYYINYYNCKVPNGYNILDGGNNASRPHSEEARKKMMQSHAALSEEEVIKLRIAYQQHQSPTKIYNELYKDKMHFNSFLNIWAGQRYKSIMPEVFTEKNRHTKLNAETVKKIREDREKLNLTYQALADKYNISKSTIADIIRKRTWKNV